MDKLYDDLWQTKTEQPFSGINSHAYFLKRDEENVLFYNTSNMDDIHEIAQNGGISFQYLSHRHETGESLSTIKKMFNSKLCADVYEEPFIKTTCEVDIIFSERTVHSKNIDVIPTPDHTEGGVCFLYHSPNGLRYLFTGDTLYRSMILNSSVRRLNIE